MLQTQLIDFVNNIAFLFFNIIKDAYNTAPMVIMQIAMEIALFQLRVTPIPMA